jgi:geranylgeranyl pyrophosphate synthase
VKHSPRLQEIAWHFARHLDLAHKIWSDLSDFRQDYKLINKSDTLMSAIYRDKYATEPIEGETRVQTSKKVQSAARSSSYSTLISSLYSSASYSAREQRSAVNELLYEKIYSDCKILFQNHYDMAFKSLDELENENSEKEAVESLRSILHVMNETVSQEN